MTHTVKTAVDNGFIHVAIANGPDTARIICTKPDGTQMVFALCADEMRSLRRGLYDAIQGEKS